MVTIQCRVIGEDTLCYVTKTSDGVKVLTRLAIHAPEIINTTGHYEFRISTSDFLSGRLQELVNEYLNPEVVKVTEINSDYETIHIVKRMRSLKNYRDLSMGQVVRVTSYRIYKDTSIVPEVESYEGEVIDLGDSINTFTINDKLLGIEVMVHYPNPEDYIIKYESETTETITIVY